MPQPLCRHLLNFDTFRRVVVLLQVVPDCLGSAWSSASGAFEVCKLCSVSPLTLSNSMCDWVLDIYSLNGSLETREIMQAATGHGSWLHSFWSEGHHHQETAESGKTIIYHKCFGENRLKGTYNSLILMEKITYLVDRNRTQVYKHLDGVRFANSPVGHDC